MGEQIVARHQSMRREPTTSRGIMTQCQPIHVPVPVRRYRCEPIRPPSNCDGALGSALRAADVAAEGRWIVRQVN